jgi:hypothetical protein
LRHYFGQRSGRNWRGGGRNGAQSLIGLHRRARGIWTCGLGNEESFFARGFRRIRWRIFPTRRFDQRLGRNWLGGGGRNGAHGLTDPHGRARRIRTRGLGNQ